jgi:hypothetical protein
VLGLPGLDFGYYRYGVYVDSIWPGCAKRPFLSSQSPSRVSPHPSTSSEPLTSSYRTAPPIRRRWHQLLASNASSLLIQSDGQYERFHSPSPAYLGTLLAQTPQGLTLRATNGPTTNDQTVNGPFVDERTLSLPANFVWPKALTIYDVPGAVAWCEPRPTRS